MTGADAPDLVILIQKEHLTRWLTSFLVVSDFSTATIKSNIFLYFARPLHKLFGIGALLLTSPTVILVGVPERNDGLPIPSSRVSRQLATDNNAISPNFFLVPEIFSHQII